MTKRTPGDKARDYWQEARVRADARKDWPAWQRAGVTVSSTPPSKPSNRAVDSAKQKTTGKR
jgi:hypothetical protein